MNGKSKIWGMVGIMLICGASADAREFKNAKGVVIDAEIKAVSGDKVTITRTADRRDFTIPIASLSEPDQAYIKDWAAKKMAGKSANPGTEPAAPTSVDPDVKPGRMVLDFPELVVDRRDSPARVSLNIPSSYDPTKPVPLFVFLAGGGGNNAPTTQGIVDGDRFITAGLPFPKGMNDSGQSNMVGDFRKIWSEYHEPMLRKIFETIPNIDKRLCVLCGFSNGAHCIGGMLKEVGEKGYPQYFNCFIPVEGGGYGRFKAGNDSFFFVSWGETSPAKGPTQAAGRKASGKHSKTFEMPGVGHSFAPVGKEKAKEWMDTVVIPATLGN
ncbi:MAG: hypothetical protein HKN23_16890 [Verrucomicrobiales bacterium]|nr:hypothetical protein [Verrucomicrobiales bacterium]